MVDLCFCCSFLPIILLLQVICKPRITDYFFFVCFFRNGNTCLILRLLILKMLFVRLVSANTAVTNGLDGFTQNFANHCHTPKLMICPSYFCHKKNFYCPFSVGTALNAQLQNKTHAVSQKDKNTEYSLYNSSLIGHTVVCVAFTEAGIYKTVIFINAIGQLSQYKPIPSWVKMGNI